MFTLLAEILIIACKHMLEHFFILRDKEINLLIYNYTPH